MSTDKLPKLTLDDLYGVEELSVARKMRLEKLREQMCSFAKRHDKEEVAVTGVGDVNVMFIPRSRGAEIDLEDFDGFLLSPPSVKGEPVTSLGLSPDGLPVLNVFELAGDQMRTWPSGQILIDELPAEATVAKALVAFTCDAV